jgi:hypothetical protein
MPGCSTVPPRPRTRTRPAISSGCMKPLSCAPASQKTTRAAGVADRYVFVSTVSVYADHRVRQVEDAPVIPLRADTPEDDLYGARKAAGLRGVFNVTGEPIPFGRLLGSAWPRPAVETRTCRPQPPPARRHHPRHPGLGPGPRRPRPGAGGPEPRAGGGPAAPAGRPGCCMTSAGLPGCADLYRGIRGHDRCPAGLGRRRLDDG